MTGEKTTTPDATSAKEAQAQADAQMLAQPNKNTSTPGDTDPAVRAGENAANPDAPKNGKSAKTTGNVVDAFLKAVKGVKEADVLAHNDERRTVVTAQGGKYQQRDGMFFTLAGPVLEGTLATTVITPIVPTHPNGNVAGEI